MDVEDLLLSRSKEGSDVNGWKKDGFEEKRRNFGILFLAKSRTDVESYYTGSMQYG